MNFFLLIVFLPLFGSFFTGFFGKFIGHFGSTIISTTLTFLSFLLSCIAFYYNLFLEQQYYIILTSWINIGLFECNWGFLFDTITITMLVIVTSISTLVHLYSIEYMKTDPHVSRFMSYLSLFTFFMLILVTSDNFLQMFVGWEGVGFCSYLLINFWFTRLQANKAAIKAMVVNRISDFFLILGLLTIYTTFKTLDYATVFSLIPYFITNNIYLFNFSINVIDCICLLLFLGAMGKSAQLFLHTWLPDAMEGPTPVSALIHAATMVTAGVFLLARCSPIFEYSNKILIFIIIIGSCTAFVASTIGLVQNDLKKIIAYSTCSQLGYMIFSCGLSNYSLSFFHLSNHAFFKALLFLSAGSVIHAMSDEQDMRKMGGLWRILPYTYSMFVIGSLSLMGFPFLTGFYSKDAILEGSFSSYTLVSHFSYTLGTISAIFTSFYSTRLIYLTFLSKTNSYKTIIINAHDAPLKMGVPLFCLALGSIFIGYFSKDMFIGLGTNFWGNSLFILPKHLVAIDSEFIPHMFKILPLYVSCVGVLSFIFLYHLKINFFYKIKMSLLGIQIFNFLNWKWFFDKLYNELIVQPLLIISYTWTYKLIDWGLIEMVGPYGLSNIILKLSKRLTLLQTGYIYNYSLMFFISLIFFIIILLFTLIK